MNDILNTVQNIVKETKRETPFTNGRPGKYWFKAFQRRNPEISIRKPERVSKARVGVTEGSIRTWFQNLKEEMEAMDLMSMFDDPSRIYNSDESNIQLCPSTGRVVGFKAWKNVYELAPGPEKSTLTFVGTFNARGDIVSPAIIYPYARIPNDIVAAVPDHFIMGKSESGWMTSDNFYEFIANGFAPWINQNQITKPVILFVDGHSTHLTLQVSTLCEDNDIILYCLPPNTTHILQPADVSVFKSLKQYWRTAVHEYQRENPNTVVRRVNVAPMLDKILDKIDRSVIINGFVACGLCPLNPDRPDYSKCLEIDRVEEELANDVPEPDLNENSDRVGVQRIEQLIPALVPELSYEERAQISRNFFVMHLLPEQVHQLDRKNGFPIDALYNIWEKMNLAPAIAIETDTVLEGTLSNGEKSSSILNGTSEIIRLIGSVEDEVDHGLELVNELPSLYDITQTLSTDRIDSQIYSSDGVGNVISFSQEEHEMVTTKPDEPSSLTRHDKVSCTINQSDELLDSAMETSVPNGSFSRTTSCNKIVAKQLSQDEIINSEASTTAPYKISISQKVPVPSTSVSRITQVAEEVIAIDKPSTSAVCNALLLKSTDHPVMSCSKKLKVLEPPNHIFWDGKIAFKKRKAPKEQTPAMISGSSYRKYILAKDAEKKEKKKTSKKRKSSDDDWECSYCRRTWEEDQSQATGKTWINCDKCASKMHIKCIPKKHIRSSGLSGHDSDGEVDFTCEACLVNSDEESD